MDVCISVDNVFAYGVSLAQYWSAITAHDLDFNCDNGADDLFSNRAVGDKAYTPASLEIPSSCGE